MISIVDYGMGNLASALKALEHLGFEARLISTPDEVAAAGALMIPGVGAFGDSMKGLAERGLVGPLRDHAAAGRPVFGICLGMQVLFESSEEDPGVQGLGILKGMVTKFRPADRAIKVPHMGWNRLIPRAGSRLMAGVPDPAHVYFVHSYHVVPDDVAVTAASCDYGIEFTAVVERGNVGGTQFHPEKSQRAGMAILRNFAEGALAVR